MRVPTLSEPNSTFPTYQVPQVSAMRGRAPPVQVARAAWEARADPPSNPHVLSDVLSVISGSSCPMDSCNLRMQSVTDNCLLNSVTEPKIQRNDLEKVSHNNSDKLACKFGALILGQDIPNKKSDALELENNDLNELNLTNSTATQYLDNELSLEDRLFDDQQRTCELEQQCYSLPLRLRGGGESSITTGTTGWGTPPSQQASNNNSNTTSGWGTANPANQNNTGTQQWNNNANRPPTSGQGPNSQDANKQNSNLPPNGQQPPTSQPNNSGWGQPGQKPPAGPGPGANSNNNPAAGNPSNNGPQGPPSNTTKQQLEQLNNMREAIFSSDGWGGQHVNQDTSWDIPGSPEPSLKMDGTGAPPWKPTINNGTELWEANLRNGGQPPPQPQQKTPWGHTPSTNIGGTWGEDDDVTDSSNVWTGVPSAQQQWGNAGGNGGGPMWGGNGPKKESEWGANAGGAGWGDPRANDPRTPSIDPREIRPDPRDIRTGTTDPMRMLDPRDQMRLVGSDMRGDPRGITGRLNGAGAAEFWTQAGPQAGAHHMHHQGKMPVGPGNGGAGWEEPSPPSQRRNMPNYDDGTSLWGNPQQGQKTAAGAAMGGRANNAGPPGMAPSRINKPEGAVWGNHGRNGSWDEPNPGWEEGTWPKQKPMAGQLWETDMDWGPHKQAPKQPLSKEMLWNSKQFRILTEMGYKKEDVENALRHRDMNVEDALEMLVSARNSNLDWRGGRHDDHFEHQQFPGQRFPSGPATQMGLPPGGSTTNILNSLNGTSATANNSLFNNMSPAIVQKMLSQSAGNLQGFGNANTTGGRSLQTPSQPSSAQLRMLVQQIQMAVQAGYLNHQILNQPLAPQTLVLLNQLLQQIKTLQQITNQHNMVQSHNLGNKQSNLLHCSVLITKTKQQISNLQNQIAASQATYVKQQQQLSSGAGGPAELFKTNSMHDTMNALQSNFVDLGIKDPQITQQQQSRLNQWKLPALDKEEGGEFSRAPGSVSKPLAPSHSSPNLNPLGFTQPDGLWSNGRSGDSGWPDSGSGDSAPDGKEPQWPTPAPTSYTDLVPEFEPGKPWRGTQMKSAEDDPTMTPGSVVRSPLSVAAIKDTELFSANPSKSPPPNDTIQPLSLSSSTWSFNPPVSTPSVFTSPPSKLPNAKGPLGELNPSTAVTSELWGAPKSRGPPPGLPNKGSSAVNGWGSNLGAGSWGQQRNWSVSPWLLLRNLTAQIDGSTLRTLCMQHGPLQAFHLYLHQGFALAKYGSREEATKAQTALNNCVLGNTTILAENPSDWDAQNILAQLANQQGGSSGAWRGSGKQPGSSSDTWSTGWTNATSNSLWGPSAVDTSEQARATPSSLNSYLPGDLLGGESM